MISPKTGEHGPAIALCASDCEDLARLETIVDHGLTGFVQVGNALIEISNRRLYRETHATFAEYCATRWQMSARRAYQLCEAAEVVNALPENVNNCSQSQITNEGQARELAKVEPARRVQVLEAASANGPLTAASIRAVVRRRHPKPAEADAAPNQLEPPHVAAHVEVAEPELAADSPIAESWWRLATPSQRGAFLSGIVDGRDRVEVPDRRAFENSLLRWADRCLVEVRP